MPSSKGFTVDGFSVLTGVLFVPLLAHLSKSKKKSLTSSTFTSSSPMFNKDDSTRKRGLLNSNYC